MRTLITSIFLLVFLLPFTADAGEIDCLKCHAKLKAEKVVHPALDMGCPTCHTGIDARTVPHKKTNTFAKGLSAEQPDLCYTCHDKTTFAKKNVHAAVSMGCTGCHNPHSSKNAKLLKAEVPALCFTCHEKPEFSKKNVHAPVAKGQCITCHSPHASDEFALLVKKPVDVCLSCHAAVAKKPHAIAGFSALGHPLGLPVKVVKKEKDKETGKVVETIEERELKDPARQGKPFYCGSCHNPHSSTNMKLFRYPAASTMDLCTNCHKM
jgi:predicted CXXCH cytochrome family protein